MNVDNNGITISTSIDNAFNSLTNALKNIKMPTLYPYGIEGSSDDTKKEGEDNMSDNKVLNLYYNKMRKKITKEYDEKSLKAYEELDVVKEYNEIVGEFEASLTELANRYNTEDKKFLMKNVGYEPIYSYELNNSLTEILTEDFEEEKKETLNKLNDFCNEVEAQLSLSDDLDYQLEVLKSYEILDKKTGKLNI